METRTLGNSDLRVSRICMGCMGFGDPGRGQHAWTLDEEHSRQILRRGLELGVNFFDTAIAYQSGTSEQYLGRALRDFARRDEVVVATKFLPRTPQEIEAGVSAREHIESSLNTSLKNLGMDYVDLYIYHMWDYATPLYDILEALDRVVRAGKARYIGISNCFAYQLAKANALAAREGFAPFVSVQGHYNLLFREEEREMARLCAEDNIAMTPYSPLAPLQAPRRDLQAPGGGRLRQAQVRRGGGPGPPDPGARGGGGGQTRREHDGGRARLAADKGHRPGRRRDEALARRGRGPRGRSAPFAGGVPVPRGALPAARPGGRHGAEHARRRKAAARLVHGRSADRAALSDEERKRFFHG